MGAPKNVMMQMVEFDGNNVLHLAGKLAPEGRYGSSLHHVLMRSEELWFQEVEKSVPPALKTMRNDGGWTPKELYYLEHKKLSEEAVSALKGIASNFLVLATLIITLGIPGGLPIPVKDIGSAQTPIFHEKIWYMIFVLSIASGTYFCAASMVFYTSVVLPSSWKPKHEYVGSRQTKLIFGNVALFVSLGIMSTAIASGSILIFDFSPCWVFYVIAAFGCIPLVLSPVFNYNLWAHYMHSMTVFCEEELQ